MAAVALSCDDVAACYATALAAGAVPLSAPAVHQEDGRRVVSASIRGFGDVDLRFVERERRAREEQPDGLLAEVDHLAVCVPSGELASTVRFMEQTLGLRQIFTEYIAVGTQGMDSIVVQSPSGGVTLTLIEPDTSRDPGQIDGFLEQHQGVGVQHWPSAPRTSRSPCRVSSSRAWPSSAPPSATTTNSVTGWATR